MGRVGGESGWAGQVRRAGGDGWWGRRVVPAGGDGGGQLIGKRQGATAFGL